MYYHNKKWKLGYSWNKIWSCKDLKSMVQVRDPSHSIHVKILWKLDFHNHFEILDQSWGTEGEGCSRYRHLTVLRQQSQAHIMAVSADLKAFCRRHEQHFQQFRAANAARGFARIFEALGSSDKLLTPQCQLTLPQYEAAVSTKEIRRLTPIWRRRRL